MKQYMIDFAKRIYLHTPYKPLRQIYFRMFCTIVRNRVIKTSVNGIHFNLDLGETIDLCIYLNKYEPEVTSAIEQLCRPGFTVLDIGANVGAHALRIANLIGESGRIYAFEPTDYAYQKLKYNISLNRFDNIIPVQVVLSDKNFSKKSINFRSSWPTIGMPAQRETIVDFTTLDDWYENEKLQKIDLIKLDVDGNEHSVILGAQALLTTQHPIIIMEVWGPNFSDQSKNPFSLLKQLGYRFFHIDSEEEYKSIDDLRFEVSSDGKLLDESYEIIAKHYNNI